MLLGEMLKVMDARLPSSFDEDSKVQFLNTYIRIAGRYLGRREIYQFETVPGLMLYPIPDYVPEETIRVVTVDAKEYRPRRYPEEVRERMYYFEPAGYMGLSPIPKKERVTVRVLYDGSELFKTRSGMDGDEDFLTQDGGLDAEYAEAVVFGALSDMAAASEEITLYNNFMERYERIIREAKQGKYNKRGKYPVTKITDGLWRRHR